MGDRLGDALGHDTWVLRPMRPGDVADAERLTAEAFHDVDLRLRPRGLPVPEPRSAARGERWSARTLAVLTTDPGGCWVVEGPDGMAGCSVSFTRELMWVLSTYAVRPGLQGAGIGRALLDAALTHGRGCLRGMFASSADPRAFRRYRLAGFSMHPQMTAVGTVDRSAIPDLPPVRDAGLADRALMDSVDRATRGGARTDHHDLLALMGRPVVTDSPAGSGYAYVDGSGTVAALAATNRRTATGLLWTALAKSTGVVELGHLTQANEWAVDVALAARLEVHTEGYLAVRGMKPPAPYVHHGALL